MNGTTAAELSTPAPAAPTEDTALPPPNISTESSIQNVDDETLRQKYSLLKKRVREIEEDNDAIHHKLTRAMRQIKRLRVERIVLLEELDQSRRREGKSKTMATSDSDGDMSDSGMNAGLKGSSRKDKRSINGTISAGRSRTNHGKQPQERKKRDPNAPKGPGNVFFLYCRMERDNIKDQLTSDNLGEATRLLGQQWKALSKEEKQVYYDLYNKELKEFEQAMELYNASGGSAGTSSNSISNGVGASCHHNQHKMSSIVASANGAAEVKEDMDDVDMLPEEDSIRDDDDVDDEPPSSLPTPIVGRAADEETAEPANTTDDATVQLSASSQ
ncbi:hypothetical protein BX666DRAFT_1914736 [Dichotomocladium elegans]|nr:hypothetical protein BX666DRAFT_1914736 [Dichotomocladium elegans]